MADSDVAHQDYRQQVEALAHDINTQLTTHDWDVYDVANEIAQLIEQEKHKARIEELEKLWVWLDDYNWRKAIDRELDEDSKDHAEFLRHEGRAEIIDWIDQHIISKGGRSYAYRPTMEELNKGGKE